MRGAFPLTRYIDNEAPWILSFIISFKIINQLRIQHVASPFHKEIILKAYRMAGKGTTTPRGKVLTNEQGKPSRLETDEAVAQAIGFMPERTDQAPTFRN